MNDSTEDTGGSRGRWPRRVYDVGAEPDPRFTFANERTFLAWIRTALALLAAGIALEAVEIPAARAVRVPLVVALALLGAVSSGMAFFRWARSERALRQSRPLPSPALAPVLGFGLAVLAVVLVVALMTS